MRKSNRLTPLGIVRLSKPGLYNDSPNLYLCVSDSGTKSWKFRYWIDGRPRKMGLGPLHSVPLAKARKRAAELREAVQDGIDPIEDRKANRAEKRLQAAKSVSFRKCAETYIESQKSGWKNAKHAGQWRATLETYAYPHIGDLAVASIDTGLVLKVLEPIWATKTETASRVRGRIKSILDWAKTREYRSGENPARWDGHLDKILPAKGKVAKVKHHKAMPYANIPAFMAALRLKTDVSARALEFTILTAARTGEVIGARRSEFDLANAVWTIPAERMKAGKEHRVPLSARCLAILKQGGGDFLFPGRDGTPLSNMAMLEMLRGMTSSDLTVHGFRSCFMDWGHDVAHYPKDMMDIALAHTVSDKVEAAYRRSDMVEKRRRLMAEWSTYCDAAQSVRAAA